MVATTREYGGNKVTCCWLEQALPDVITPSFIRNRNNQSIQSCIFILSFASAFLHFVTFLWLYEFRRHMLQQSVSCHGLHMCVAIEILILF
jgi:hypothetical protein